MELWRDITDFPNYEVSNFGNVRNKSRGNILKPMAVPKNNGKYICYQVTLYNDEYKKRGKHSTISRLVASAFITNTDPDNKTDVDHINGKTEDNRSANLRWATRSENIMNQNSKTKPNKSTGVRNIVINPAGSFCVNIKGKHIGAYETLTEAKEAKTQYLNGELEPAVRQESALGKYITLSKQRNKIKFAVSIRTKEINHFHRFNTLEEAVAARDAILATYSAS